MKKKYKKPRVFMESFALSEHIAGCNLTLSNLSPHDCTASGTISTEDGIVDQSNAWFVSSNTSCTLKTEGYCYTNASFNVATINS